MFRDRSNNITARQVRAHGAVAVHKTPMPQSAGSPSAPDTASSYVSNPATPSKSSNPFRILTSERRHSILPSYHAKSPSVTASPPYQSAEPISPTSKYSRATDCTKKKLWGGFMGRKSGRQSVGPRLPVNASAEREMEISAPMGVNPQFAHLVQRPDSALHPSRTGESEAFRWKANA